VCECTRACAWKLLGDLVGDWLAEADIRVRLAAGGTPIMCRAAACSGQDKHPLHIQPSAAVLARPRPHRVNLQGCRVVWHGEQGHLVGVIEALKGWAGACACGCRPQLPNSAGVALLLRSGRAGLFFCSTLFFFFFAAPRFQEA